MKFTFLVTCLGTISLSPSQVLVPKSFEQGCKLDRQTSPYGQCHCNGEKLTYARCFIEISASRT